MKKMTMKWMVPAALSAVMLTACGAADDTNGEDGREVSAVQKLYNERERTAMKLKDLEERAPKYVKVLDVNGSRAHVVSTMGAPVEEDVTLERGVKVKKGEEVIIQEDEGRVRVLKTEKLVRKAEDEAIELKKRYSELDAEFREKYGDITQEKLKELAEEAKKTLKEEK